MEHWSSGVLDEISAIQLPCFFPILQYSITPTLQYSNLSVLQYSMVYL
jgi:hypothetical protein